MIVAISNSNNMLLASSRSNTARLIRNLFLRSMNNSEVLRRADDIDYLNADRSLMERSNLDERDEFLDDSNLHHVVVDSDDVVALNLAATETNLDEVVTNSRSALHAAARHGDVDVIKALLPAYIKIVNEKNHVGETLLHLAAARGHADVIQVLLAAGAKVDEKNSNGQTALHMAVTTGHVDALHVIKETFFINVDNINEWVTVHTITAGHVEVMHALLAAGANIHEKCDFKGYMLRPLCLAALFGNIAAVGILLVAGAKADEVDDDGIIALTLASAGNHVAVVHALLAAGAKVDEKIMIATLL